MAYESWKAFCSRETNSLQAAQRKEKKEKLYSCKIFCHWTWSNATNHNVLFLPDSPQILSKKVLNNCWIHVPKMIHRIMVFIQSIIFQDWEFSLKQLIISFRLNWFKISFTKIFMVKMISCTLVISRIDSRYDHCKWKILGKVDGCQNIHHQLFWSYLTNSCCRAVPDDRFEVQNDPTCTNVGFSLSSLPREGGIWRKGTMKFSCSPGTWRSISRYAGQDAVQSNHKCQ